MKYKLVCFDVDGSRILVIDENGLEVNFEDLLMLFVGFEEKIVKSKGSTIVTTPNIPLPVKKFIEESGYPVVEVENHPGAGRYYSRRRRSPRYRLQRRGLPDVRVWYRFPGCRHRV